MLDLGIKTINMAGVFIFGSNQKDKASIYETDMKVIGLMEFVKVLELFIMLMDPNIKVIGKKI